MADLGAQQTTRELGQPNRSVISALLKQVNERKGAMQVPGHSCRLSTTCGMGVVVVVVVFGLAVVVAAAAAGRPGSGPTSDLSPLDEAADGGDGRSKTAPAKVPRSGPASREVSGLLNGLVKPPLGLAADADPPPPCLGFESQHTAPRSHRSRGLLMTTDGLVQKADIRPGRQTPGQRVRRGFVVVGVVGAGVVVVVVLVALGRPAEKEEDDAGPSGDAFGRLAAG